MVAEVPGQAPVSAFLEKRVRAELASGPVLWLDKDGVFTGFVDRLTERRARGEFSAPVYALRGSYLELLLAMSADYSLPDAPPLLVHLPGLTRTSIRPTPLLEAYECSRPFELALETVIREASNGLVAAEDIDAFLSSSPPSLDRADQWLAARLSGAALGDSWVSTLDADGVVDSFVQVRARDTSAAALSALHDRMRVLFGSTDPLPTHAQEQKTLADLLAESIARWLLLVEFTHDLGREPHAEELKELRRLPAPTVARCVEQVERLRSHRPNRYRELARAVEPSARAEGPISPEDLGKIDTFPFEEDAIFSGAVDAIVSGAYERARTWAERRERAGSVWLEVDQPRRWAWELIGSAARLGTSLAAAADLLSHAVSFEEALDEYAQLGAAVDRAQRQFEQRVAELRGPQLPRQSELAPAFEALRSRYFAWVDAVNTRFAQLCQNDPLPPPELQQRNLFEQAVRPLLESDERVALFTIDALRFEMATELLNELAGAASSSRVDGPQQLLLRARLAELPTLTAVGMNVLPPVTTSEGRLRPTLRDGAFAGFRAGEWNVASPEDRRRAMANRVPGGKAPQLLNLKDDVCGSTPESLKKSIAHAKLILVHGLDLDEAGEAGFGVHLFERLLRDISTGIHNLQAAGVRHFVITSDHGFLLHDRPASIPFDSEVVARRHVFSSVERRMPGVLTVPLSCLGYLAEGYLLFPEDGRVFGRGGRSAFLHGGNSLQERVIPVLSISRARAPGRPASSFRVECEPGQSFMGIQCVKVRVRLEEPEGQAPLQFASAPIVDLVLCAANRSDVTALVKELRGSGASIHQQKLRLTAGSDWAEVYFSLEGEVDERAAISIVSADARVQVKGATSEILYDIAGRTKAAPAPSSDETWANAIADEGHRRVLLHLFKHRDITEEDVIRILGSPRKARAFTNFLDGYRPLLPFEVRIDVGVRGKRYLVSRE